VQFQVHELTAPAPTSGAERLRSVDMRAHDLIRVRRLAQTGAARAIRRDAGLSLAEVADEASVHRTTVFRWETGSRKPRGEAALRYLAVLEELSSR
jgi:DNA-binding transcriptional regulator YiaG